MLGRAKVGRVGAESAVNDVRLGRLLIDWADEMALELVLDIEEHVLRIEDRIGGDDREAFFRRSRSSLRSRRSLLGTVLFSLFEPDPAIPLP